MKVKLYLIYILLLSVLLIGCEKVEQNQDIIFKYQLERSFYIYDSLKNLATYHNKSIYYHVLKVKNLTDFKQYFLIDDYKQKTFIISIQNGCPKSIPIVAMSNINKYLINPKDSIFIPFYNKDFALCKNSEIEVYNINWFLQDCFVLLKSKNTYVIFNKSQNYSLINCKNISQIQPFSINHKCN